MPDRECRDCKPGLVKAFLAVVANWPTTVRAGLLMLLLVGALVVVGLLSLNVVIGPVEVGSR
jgi:hypothetical protein